MVCRESHRHRGVTDHVSTGHGSCPGSCRGCGFLRHGSCPGLGALCPGLRRKCPMRGRVGLGMRGGSVATKTSSGPSCGCRRLRRPSRRRLRSASDLAEMPRIGLGEALWATRRPGPTHALRPPCYAAVGLRRRTPGPPPSASMKTTPAASSVWRIIVSVARLGIALPVSKRFTVDAATLARMASSRTVQLTAALPIRLCEAVSTRLLCTLFLLDERPQSVPSCGHSLTV
jgi:hypothetical protein